MIIDGDKLKAAMKESGVSIPQLMKATRLSQGRISQLRSNGGNVNDLSGKAMEKRVGAKLEPVEGE